jgi:hypothetical protein
MVIQKIPFVALKRALELHYVAGLYWSGFHSAAAVAGGDVFLVRVR